MDCDRTRQTSACPIPREHVSIETWGPPKIWLFSSYRESGNTGEQIRDHKLATSIINLHGTEDCVFDDQSLDLLKQFVLVRSDESREEFLMARGWKDEPGAKPGRAAVEKDGSLVGVLVARYGTEEAAFDERDWELLEEWMMKGMPTGENVKR